MLLTKKYHIVKLIYNLNGLLKKWRIKMNFFKKFTKYTMLSIFCSVLLASIYAMNNQDALSDQDFEEWLQNQQIIASPEKENDKQKLSDQNIYKLTVNSTNLQNGNSENNKNTIVIDLTQDSNDNNEKTLIDVIENSEEPTSNCSICFDDVNESDFCKLDCGHSYCNDCLTSIIDLGLKEKKTTNLVCPNKNCSKAIDEQSVRKIVKNDKNKLADYAEITTHEWLVQQPNAKHCPTPNCPYVFLNDTQHPQTITCQACNKEYCSHCLFLHDQTLTCEQAEKNRPGDKQSEEWKQKNTKNCPRCESSIEKDGGCKYVRCTTCKREFCWECLGLYEHQDHICNPINRNNQQEQVNLQNQLIFQEQLRQEQIRRQEEMRRLQEEARRQEELRRQQEIERRRQQELERIRQAKEKEEAELRIIQKNRQDAYDLERTRNTLYRAIMNDNAEGIREAVRLYLELDVWQNDREASLRQHTNQPSQYNFLNQNPLNPINGSYKTPLELAVSLAKSNAVKALLECGASPHHFLDCALNLGDIKTALALIQHGAKFTHLTMESALRFINQEPRICFELIQELINKGYDLNSYDKNANIWSLIIKCAYYLPQNEELSKTFIELLLKNGANPNDPLQGYPFLFQAIESNDLTAVKILLEAGANTQVQVVPSQLGLRNPLTPLAYALARQNHRNCGINPEIIQLLRTKIVKKKNVNRKN